MANKMLIDATHPEETRVVVVRGNRVEEFDFEAANRKQLRGNIYLAKVTRVEPSLQAAFVDYGGNRHGFLAFSEIHPDYYQIPMADRQALLDEEEADEASAEEVTEKPRRRRGKAAAAKAETEEDTVASEASDNGDDESNGANAGAESASDDNGAETATDDNDDSDGNGDDDDVESVGAEDAMEEVPQRVRRHRKQYKIQEVIKRRQVLLVQVVKEERGNKGAALTTYLSLAGRYSVLMPNTARGGGISRKITNPTDRKRLKKIASELEVPEGMGVILRTAGASRTKAEIKRDFEYLMRLWENVRDLTLQSSAPYLVYEEGSLIKRSIRDLYNKDIEQVLVAGDEGYREAKDFMRMLMPSHAKNVQPYKEATPIFSRFMVESQLDAMFSPQVTLKSGGYLVINQTEALVAIDVNSGKSTREHNIEDTAVQTNLEAAEEVARQLRLRDLAGLIVIDFIDMEENKNNRAVERKVKECLKNDRARIQVGRISHFGLLEMSRQRIRTGVLESSMTPCPHCHGTGMIRSVESVALHVLRSIEDMLLKGVTHNLIVRTTTEAALYILNQKRAHLSDLEARFGLEIAIEAAAMENGHHYLMERGEPVEPREIEAQPLVQPHMVTPITADDQDEDESAEATETERSRDDSTSSEDDGSGRKRRRRRRRRKSGGGDEESRQDAARDETSGEGESDDSQGEAAADKSASDEDGEEDRARRKRRRGRRGGRRGRRDGEGTEETNEATAEASDTSAETSDGASGEGPASDAAAQTAPEVASETAETAPVEAGEGETAPAAPALTETAVAESAEPVAASENEPAEAASAEETVPAPVSATDDSAPAETVETGTAEAIETPADEPAPLVAAETEAEPQTEAEPEAGQTEAGESETVTPEAEPEVAAEAEPAVTAEAKPEPVAPAAPKEPVVVSEKIKGDGTAEETEETGPKRSGWWQRRSFF
ncbi:Rne/Rng family ribonuclease [Stappia taiwanensis]|uniref:Ribonuclease E n=1 Tax=Stappia taiwanensis TaxID=992267 RepID=A0A838XM81_9HYPH|nr:ribonuclease E/G [Stappia taiwanensis]MBA4611615.1 Rne/Rng family ribonuclease [Stappia taiwanensis]GGE98229.1 ribonuclease E [Stappia taiwanensis]